MSVQVFISYRRVGGLEIARNVYDRLTMDGYITFFDYDSMRAGKFNEQIFVAIERATDFILILNKGALDGCLDENDWVRKELEFAIAKNKHIVFWGDESFVFPKLPDSLKDILNIEILPYNHNFYNASFKRLKDNLHSKPRKFYKRALLIGILVVFTLLGLLLIICRDKTRTSALVEVTAEMYLSRYNEIDTCFSKMLLSEFSYHDSLDIQGVECVYARSCSYPMFFHYPIFTIRLISKQHDTVVFHTAEVEIKNYKLLDSIKKNESSVRLNKCLNAFYVKMPTIYINEGTYLYEIPEFVRSLVRGETDDRFKFSLASHHTCSFDARLKLKSINNEVLYSEYVHITIFRPDNSVLNPYYN